MEVGLMATTNGMDYREGGEGRELVVRRWSVAE